jgi:hypothetical protein
MLLICIPTFHSSSTNPLRVLDDLGVETLGVLDVDGLDIRVQLLLSALLVITLTADADTEAEWHALDTGFPDLLVELGVKADILGALGVVSMLFSKSYLSQYSSNIATMCECHHPGRRCLHTIAFSANPRISLMALGALFLKLTP